MSHAEMEYLAYLVLRQIWLEPSFVGPFLSYLGWVCFFGKLALSEMKISKQGLCSRCGCNACSAPLGSLNLHLWLFFVYLLPSRPDILETVTDV